MLVYKIVISKKVRKDIKKIGNYVKRYNIDKVIKKIYEDIEELDVMPRIHKTLYSYKDPNGEYRRMISGKYIIIYKIIKNRIIIIRIFSQKQNYLDSKKFILKEKSQTYQIINKGEK